MLQELREFWSEVREAFRSVAHYYGIRHANAD